MPTNRPATDQVAECAECGRTSPLTLTGDGTPKGWGYISDEQITLCPLHKRQLPEGWQDVIRIYKRGEFEELLPEDACRKRRRVVLSCC